MAGIVAAGALAVPLLFLLPAASATFVMLPTYNQGCNGNPFGVVIQYPPIGHTAKTLNSPTLAGGYLNSGVSGAQWADSVGSTSSAIQTSEYFMIGPHLGTPAYSCWTPGANKVVSATFNWSVQMNPYLGANCTSGASSTASFNVFVVGNFHILSAPYYLITPVSPHKVVDAMVAGCGGPYAPGNQAFTVTITTPNVNVIANTAYDFYTAIWVYTQIQTLAPPGTAAAYAGVTWEATFTGASCNGC